MLPCRVRRNQVVDCLGLNQVQFAVGDCSPSEFSGRGRSSPGGDKRVNTASTKNGEP